MSGAKAVVEALKLNDVRLVLDMTGHTVMEVADELAKDGSIGIVYPRTEMSGTDMAYGYNRVKGGPHTVCLWRVAGMNTVFGKQRYGCINNSTCDDLFKVKQIQGGGAG